MHFAGTLKLTAIAVLLGSSAIAEAQTYVMRHKLSKKPLVVAPAAETPDATNPSPPAPPPSPPPPSVPVTWAWDMGYWGSWSSSCSENAVRTRSVVCRSSQGAVGSDDKCEGARPTSLEMDAILTGCPPPVVHTYEWQAGSWGSWSTRCSAAAVRTRPVTCVRDDGQLAGDGSCSIGNKPSSSETKEDYSGCSNRIQYNDATMAQGQYCQGQISVTQNVWCVNRYGTPQNMSVCNAEGIATPPETISLPCTRRDFVTGNAFWSQGIPAGYNYRTEAYPGRLSEAEATTKALAQCNSSDYVSDVANHGFCYFVSYTWVPRANVTIVEAGPRNSANQGSAGSFDMTGSDRRVLNRFNTMTHEFVVDDSSMDKFQRRLIQCGQNFAVSNSNNYVAAVRCVR